MGEGPEPVQLAWAWRQGDPVWAWGDTFRFMGRRYRVLASRFVSEEADPALRTDPEAGDLVVYLTLVPLDPDDRAPRPRPASRAP